MRNMRPLMKNLKLPLIPIIIFLIVVITFIGNAHGKVKIKSITHLQKSGKSLVTVGISGNLSATPELKIKNSEGSSIVQLSIPNSIVWPKIEKKVTLADKKFDTTLTAYQYDKNLVRFRAILPYSIKDREKDVQVVIRENKIDLSFPSVKISTEGLSFKKTKRKKKSKAEVSKYDEKYLEELLKDKENSKNKLSKTILNNDSLQAKDEVKVSQAAIEKDGDATNKSGFSISNYVGKFVGFLGLILLFFYGIVHLLRKGVIKKGRLGFLNDMKTVRVLNTTYIAPKKTLMLVKAHNQVFLLANDEKGIHYLSELSDVTGLIKEGEQVITGSNFDSSLVSADDNKKDFKLKEEIVEENKTEQNEIKDKVKFSDQIKNKVKTLKQLQ
jgi:flagellar biogenesis protein FliO